ncbi:GGDEF domain-containing protein [Vibrio sp. CAU 1672]|uniref:GGDEF domain-containing protein n=1 Tax=Vibrio sp. CAU 1672 TaxID=3032594 RepID=UPI0023D9968A|nr:GGDEF domain-containing protein [Vibrio sp. CAU 1672]MDF2155610.1 GGDEF domain-containing protein [Vibrio sp. CAU 1672]
MKNWFKERHYLVLVIVTLGLLTWHHFGMVATVSVPAEAFRRATLLNDTVNGGRSTGELFYAQQSLRLQCQTAHSLTFPFCSMMIPLVEDPTSGLDLRRYDTLIFTLAYHEAQNLHDTVLIYLLNAEPNTAEHPAIDLRANLSTISQPSGQSVRYALRLDQFHVPSWWYLARPTDISTSRNLDQVQYLQISTGDSRALKNTEIIVRDVSIKGKWIDKETLYIILLSVWVVYAIMHSGWRFFSLKKQVRAKEIQLEILQDEKEKYAVLAKTDALTGVLNRNGFNYAYEQHSKSPTFDSLILFDVDDFKLINDTYGHDKGDQVLIQLTRIVSALLREHDELVRWGGEEFIIFCPQTKADGALAFAERIRSKIESLRISKRVSITCSFGVAPILTTFDLAFQSADKALYLAKERGKNRVECIERW